MPVCHRRKVIFIHIPKNAGESVEKTLGIYGGGRKRSARNPFKRAPIGRDESLRMLWGVIDKRTVLQHLTALEVREMIGETLWRSYFKFAIVRNPWSKAVSEYNWYLRYGPWCSFEEWVWSLERRIEINRAIHKSEIGHNIRQCDYVADKAGSLLVDEVLRFETIQEDFSRLSRSRDWGVRLIFDTATSSKDRRDFRSYYNESTASEIERIYVRDIERFGYSRDATFGQNTAWPINFALKGLALMEFCSGGIASSDNLS